MRGDWRGRLLLASALALSLSLTLPSFFFVCGRTHKIIARRRVQPIGVRVQRMQLTVRVCVPNCMSFVIHQRGMRCGLRVAAALSPRRPSSCGSVVLTAPSPLSCEKIVKILLEMLEMRRPPF